MTSHPSAPAAREGAEPARCWQCGKVHAPSLFCPSCDAIQPLPAHTDYFQILGVEPRLVIDRGALERRYFDLSRRLHPDKFQTGPAPARIASLGNTASLNRAYRTLRDPIERGLYWLSLQGETLGSNNNRVPAELAALVFEVQEQLEALREDAHNVTLRDEVCARRTDLGQRAEVLRAQLDDNFARWDAAGAGAASLTQELKSILSTLKYLRTLMRDVDKELEG
ncbi:MAG: Fe-S protein assembly co-chaperone HscB [Deltaproteobacteria bacterium]|nr:Fe-S protein assembly co-chaperone HscB [Deltaproteobacteria bacterium]MBI3389779.1 Fe-S protein assembly co-chaperone HscB [Deltaproteobacteria bacterium]